MILQIKLQSTNQIILPLHYKSQLQGLLYGAMDSDHQDFLHNQGYSDDPRNFRLFTFSDIQETARRYKKKLIFKDEITIFFSSHNEDLCMSIARNMMKNRQRIGSNYFENVDVGVAKPQVVDDLIKVQTMSPIVCYETLHHPNGKAYYNYFPADHPSFAITIRRNIIRKFNIIYPNTTIALPDEKEMTRIIPSEQSKIVNLSTFSENTEEEKFTQNNEDSNFDIQPLGKTKQEITYYKNSVIKGVRGAFLIRAKPELLQVVLDCGLGSKNSQGFGMIMRIN